MRRSLLSAAALATSLFLMPLTAGSATQKLVIGAQAGDPVIAELQARAAEIVKASPARIGIAAIDLTTGRMVSVNGGKQFPMASTVKVAIAAAFLKDVQKGRLSLTESYGLSATAQKQVSKLGDMRWHRGRMTGAQLLDMMLVRSDNTAADILLAQVGGVQGVSRWLTSAGVEGQRVDRSIAQLLDDHETRKRVRVGKGRHRRWIYVSVPRPAASGDFRDSSTPEAMALLLARLRNGELLDAERTAYLFDVMSRCRTGPTRIRGLLPSGTPVAHKTGTMRGITDDVGIVSLPNGRDIAIAVFVSGNGGVGAQNRSIARLSRMMYDGFNNDTMRTAAARGGVEVAGGQ